jgi:hypothetical protein
VATPALSDSKNRVAGAIRRSRQAIASHASTIAVMNWPSLDRDS